MISLEQTINSLLLKERWSLIQSGVQRKSIKLRADTLLVNGKLHGKVSNGMMKLITSDRIQPEPTLVSSPTQSGPTTARTESRNDPITANSDSSSAAQSGSQ